MVKTTSPENTIQAPPDKQEQVLQKNVITAARYIFTVTEKRLLYCIARELQKSHNENLFGEVIVPVKIKTLLRGEEDENYTAIKSAAKMLCTRTIELKTSDKWEVFTILSGAVHERGSGIISVTLSHHILPYFANLHKSPEVTRLGFNQALSLKSHYSQRFYEFISRFKDTGWWSVDIDALRAMLKLESKYLKFDELKRRVLDVAARELAEKTELSFTWECAKEGKKVVRLHFKIHATESAERVFAASQITPPDVATVEALRGKLRLSPHQTGEICRLVPESEIKQTIYDIQIANMAKPKDNLAAYAWKVFNEKYPILKTA